MMPTRITSLLLCLSLLLALSACGNKGPLQLPDEEEEKRERSSY